MTTLYTPDHEWINLDNQDAAIVGITLHAQDALGDVVFVDLPEVGRSFSKGEVAGVVESVKAAADLFMPVSGEVVEVNEALRAEVRAARVNGMREAAKIAMQASERIDYQLQAMYEHENGPPSINIENWMMAQAQGAVLAENAIHVAADALEKGNPND